MKDNHDELNVERRSQGYMQTFSNLVQEMFLFLSKLGAQRPRHPMYGYLMISAMSPHVCNEFPVVCPFLAPRTKKAQFSVSYTKILLRDRSESQDLRINTTSFFKRKSFLFYLQHSHCGYSLGTVNISISVWCCGKDVWLIHHCRRWSFLGVC